MTDSRFQLKFFHLGMYSNAPVRMYEVVDGRRSEIAYDPAMFDYGKSGLDRAALPEDLGFAGFRVNFHTDWTRDVAAFLGASYFRAVGGECSTACRRAGWPSTAGWPARGVPALHRLLARAGLPPTQSVLTVYALLDSPSVAGAYRFDIRPAERW